MPSLYSINESHNYINEERDSDAMSFPTRLRARPQTTRLLIFVGGGQRIASHLDRDQAETRVGRREEVHVSGRHHMIAVCAAAI